MRSIAARYRSRVDVVDLFGLDTLLAQFVFLLGLAMVIGNAYAVYKARRGEVPKGAQGEFRPVRAYWLMAVGVVIAIWGGISLFT